MRHFGTILFGLLTAISILAVLWLSLGAGTKDPYTKVFGIVVSPILYLVLVGPFLILFVVSLVRGLKK